MKSHFLGLADEIFPTFHQPKWEEDGLLANIYSYT